MANLTFMEFTSTLTNTYLHARQVYPPNSFQNIYVHNLVVPQSLHAQVSSYLHQVLGQAWDLFQDQQLRKLVLRIGDVEALVMEFDYKRYESNGLGLWQALLREVAR